MVNGFDVITLFPEMVQSVCSRGVTGRAVTRGLVSLRCWNPRNAVEDVNRVVDNRPYGGGPGMVMMADPLDKVLAQVREVSPDSKLVYLSPQGRQITHALLCEQRRNLIFLCGRYEGIDERFIEAQVEEEWSLGDFVLSGGEVAAIAAVDALTRLIPGVLGHEQSAEQDSFSDGLLDCPHYTRPYRWRGRDVPDVLMKGHHEEIERWRLKQSLGRTWQRRPDLLELRELSDEEHQLLNEFIGEQKLN